MDSSSTANRKSKVTDDPVERRRILQEMIDQKFKLENTIEELHEKQAFMGDLIEGTIGIQDQMQAALSQIKRNIVKVIGSEAQGQKGVTSNPNDMPMMLAMQQAAAVKEAEEKHEEQTANLRELMRRSMRGAQSVGGSRKDQKQKKLA